MEQTAENLEDYLVSMRQISDTVYYNVIKESDFSSQEQDIQTKMNLLYEANKDNLQTIALYDRGGNLMAAEPVADQKENIQVSEQSWFVRAAEEMENMHFSTPHIQNLFDDGTQRYYWVISLSRVVELTDKGVSQPGVLLVDMDYSAISRMMKQINTSNNGQYYYLCDSNGEIIYHPRQIQISDGISSENSGAVSEYKDGVYNETFEGEQRQVVVNTISYTGWKLVGVVPRAGAGDDGHYIFLFGLSMLLFSAFLMAFLNFRISARISDPIRRLEQSVKELEAGAQEVAIREDGCYEVRRLAHSIASMVSTMRHLMDDIIQQEKRKRRSELEVLQSQINPHFLYNTLSTLNWLVRAGDREDACRMIVSLGDILRAALSPRDNSTAVQLARSYIDIQQLRYKNRAVFTLTAEGDLEHWYLPHFTLQPLVENAIHYGVEQSETICHVDVCAVAAGGVLTLTVHNTGAPIPAEHLPHLFERFYRTDAARTGENGNYGLGLAIAKAITTSHKGSIDVQCHDHRVEFLVRFPLSR